jgi:hypothetical protein
MTSHENLDKGKTGLNWLRKAKFGFLAVWGATMAVTMYGALNKEESPVHVPAGVRPYSSGTNAVNFLVTKQEADEIDCGGTAVPFLPDSNNPKDVIEDSEGKMFVICQTRSKTPPIVYSK